jgi:hypothetical protein
VSAVKRHRVHLTQVITPATITNARREEWGWFCLASRCSAKGGGFAAANAAARDGARHLDAIASRGGAR